MGIQKIPEISVASTGVQSVERNVLQGRIFFPLAPSYNTPLPTQRESASFHVLWAT